MKKSFASFAVFVCVVLHSAVGQASLIGYWNFNGLTNSTNNGTSYSPNSGSGAINLIGWTTTASTGITAFGGTTTNALFSDPAGQSLALQGGAGSGTPNNGARMVLSFDLSNFVDPILSFATQRSGTGFNSDQVAWSTDGTTYTNFGSAYVPASSFAIQSFDFSTVNALDQNSTVFLRITFSGATSSTGNNRIDNVQLNAMAVPSPSSFAILAGISAVFAFGARRKLFVKRVHN